jgi:rhodanese-related sulfurtransferase
MSPTSRPTLSASEVRQLMASNPRTRVIDVRSAGEFAALHIPGSYNVPLELLREHGGELRAEHDDPVVLVCRSGMRADQARDLLDRAGLDNLSVLETGLTAWERAGAPLNRGKARWVMERQVRLTAGSLVVAGIVGGLFVPELTWLAGAIGAGLVVSAVTDTCAMARLLSLLPINRVPTCDAGGLLAALTDQRTNVA